MIDYYHPNIELTLCGCGFLGLFHIGAIHLLKQIWPHRPFERISGASCGGFVATLYCCGFETSYILKEAVSCTNEFRAFIKNPTYLPRLHEKVESALESLPHDAHERCSGRLGLSLTKTATYENIYVTQFRSRQEVIDACAAGCFIPIWSGALKCRPFNNENYMDGGFTDNLPAFPRTSHGERPEVRHLYLQAVSTSIQISPKDDFHLGLIKLFGARYYINWRNVVRGAHALFGAPMGTLRNYLLSGYQEMKNHILDNDFIRCRNCHSARSVVKPCLSCLRLLERVDSLRVPEEILNILS